MARSELECLLLVVLKAVRLSELIQLLKNSSMNLLGKEGIFDLKVYTGIEFM